MTVNIIMRIQGHLSLHFVSGVQKERERWVGVGLCISPLGLELVVEFCPKFAQYYKNKQQSARRRLVSFLVACNSILVRWNLGFEMDSELYTAFSIEKKLNLCPTECFRLMRRISCPHIALMGSISPRVMVKKGKRVNPAIIVLLPFV